MLKNFDHVKVTVYLKNGDKVGMPSKMYTDILLALNNAAKTMDRLRDVQEEYFEGIGINSRGSFAGMIEDEIFTYLANLDLQNRCGGFNAPQIDIIAAVEYGSDGVDHYMVNLKRD